MKQKSLQETLNTVEFTSCLVLHEQPGELPREQWTSLVTWTNKQNRQHAHMRGRLRVISGNFNCRMFVGSYVILILDSPNTCVEA